MAFVLIFELFIKHLSSSIIIFIFSTKSHACQIVEQGKWEISFASFIQLHKCHWMHFLNCSFTRMACYFIVSKWNIEWLMILWFCILYCSSEELNNHWWIDSVDSTVSNSRCLIWNLINQLIVWLQAIIYLIINRLCHLQWMKKHGFNHIPPDWSNCGPSGHLIVSDVLLKFSKW